MSKSLSANKKHTKTGRRKKGGGGASTYQNVKIENESTHTQINKDKACTVLQLQLQLMYLEGGQLSDGKLVGAVVSVYAGDQVRPTNPVVVALREIKAERESSGCRVSVCGWV